MPRGGICRRRRSSIAVEHDAVVDLHRSVVAQELLDRVLGELGVVAQQRELVGMAEQRDLRVAEEVLGRLVAGLEQQDAVGDELGVGEPLAVGLGFEQRRQQIVARVGAAALSASSPK